MSSRLFRLVAVALLLSLSIVPTGAALSSSAHSTRKLSFDAKTGGYSVSFRAGTGAIVVTPRGKKAGFAIRELAGGSKQNLLYHVTAVHRSGPTITLTGRASWTTFSFSLDLRSSIPGLVHFALAVTPFRHAPAVLQPRPDIQLVRAPPTSLNVYAAAPPLAGTSLFLSSRPTGSSALYLADFTSLGQFFDRTGSGATQNNFQYPGAGTAGALVGAGRTGSFGYIPPSGSFDHLPQKKTTRVIDSYLYLLPTIPANETAMADTYLKMLGTVYSVLPKPSVPAADWKTLAEKTATDLADPANLVTVDGRRYLRSYVSDTRASPELITQSTVVAGMKAFEARYSVTIPLASELESNLETFYDPGFHSVVNGLAAHTTRDATGESWYQITILISLLQTAQLGSAIARKLLLDSADSAMKLAHVNNYEFPQTFRYSDWNGKDSGVQADVAGGYAWLMLGLYDLTKDEQYLAEAKASIAHVAGKGFGLAYEPHMSAYTAAAAQRLFVLTSESRYHGYALLALANVFHVTSLWDCTYGLCKKGSGYHTYFGLNCLPSCDYVAMLEQYQAWLGLRSYLEYAAAEPAYVRDLVNGFVDFSPRTLRYSLPTQLPPGVALSAAGLYSFVTHNNLAWNIPIEDLRPGELTSGGIGQEIYGAGGPFMFAAYAPTGN